MFDIPKQVLIAASILTIAAGFGMLVFAFNLSQGTIDRATFAGGGVFLLVAGVLTALALWELGPATHDE